MFDPDPDSDSEKTFEKHQTLKLITLACPLYPCQMNYLKADGMIPGCPSAALPCWMGIYRGIYNFVIN
jgi:hypothetical protein